MLTDRLLALVKAHRSRRAELAEKFLTPEIPAEQGAAHPGIRQEPSGGRATRAAMTRADASIAHIRATPVNKNFEEQ